MEAWMVLLISFIIIQRFIELIIARNNERWLKDRGGVETGQRHYKWFIYLHTLFFISIIMEIVFSRNSTIQINYYLLLIFIAAQIGRVWCIYTLGRFWNTKVITIPRISLIKKGPYKYIKHPNYVIVAVELFIIPLLFGAYITACVFPILHIILLKVRIPIEEKALAIK